MNSLPLKSVVEHDVRLDILCCLNGKPLTVSLMSARTDRPERHVGHHIKVLDSFRLVEKARDSRVGRLSTSPVSMSIPPGCRRPSALIDTGRGERRGCGGRGQRDPAQVQPRASNR